jgi:hypothetical protein
MAQERYIDADALVTKLRNMYVSAPAVYVPSYGSSGSSLDAALQQILSNSVGGAMTAMINDFKHQIIMAIEQSATLKGTPCFLCKQRDGDELPQNIHGCGQAPRSAA